MDKRGRAEDTHERRRLIERLLHSWEQQPALRLAQLIGNSWPDDAYHVEDEAFVARIERSAAGRQSTDPAPGQP